VYYKEFARRIPREVRKFIPLLKPDYAKVLQHWEWSQGLHKIGKNQLYVNRGLGTYFPGRLFCPPEVTLITLE
ncbi:MAG: metallophosphoesterase, partial [Cyanobacteria bacterium J06643_5]